MNGVHKGQRMKLCLQHPVGVNGRSRKEGACLVTDFIVPETFQHLAAAPRFLQFVGISRQRIRIKIPVLLYRHKDKVGRCLGQQTGACQQGVRFPYVYTGFAGDSRKLVGSRIDLHKHADNGKIDYSK